MTDNMQVLKIKRNQISFQTASVHPNTNENRNSEKDPLDSNTIGVINSQQLSESHYKKS